MLRHTVNTVISTAIITLAVAFIAAMLWGNRATYNCRMLWTPTEAAGLEVSHAQWHAMCDTRSFRGKVQGIRAV